MTDRKIFLHKLKPGIPKRALLFLAGAVWTFAGGMLLWRGAFMLMDAHEFLWLKILISAVAGGLFYYFLFDRISLKHSSRIQNLPHERPCAFSFFNWKSYLMMGLMITMGITLRSTGIVPTKYLAPMYITMGIPLAISALRFYKHGIHFYKKK